MAVVYSNGRYVPRPQAVTSVEDRGLLFADGVYEVIHVRGGKLVDATRHYERLQRSAAEIRLPAFMSITTLDMIIKRLIRLNSLRFGQIYLHITRGAARRDFPFPKAATPNVLIIPYAMKPVAKALLEKGVKVVTVPDRRWKRCDIKSIALLPAVLAKQEAKDKGGFEAWQYDEDGFITEGASTNAWILTQENVFVTHPTSPKILAGITRQKLMELLAEQGVRYEERPFTVHEAKAAKEAFLCSTTTYLIPIVQIDDTLINDGKVGSLAKTLRDAYDAFAQA
jgi:D-alanine transaminase